MADDIDFITTSDGVDLEAELARGDDAVASALLTHPHPQFGGSMRSLVTSELFGHLPRNGISTLRFNFRGVERSGGSHDGGHGEQLDVIAGLDALDRLAPGLPIVVAGWSFGADVALAVDDPRIAGWFCIAAPMTILSIDQLSATSDPRPKLLAVPEHDQFNPPKDAQATSASWVNTRMEIVSGGDHFLAGRTARVVELLVGFVGEIDG